MTFLSLSISTENWYNENNEERARKISIGNSNNHSNTSRIKKIGIMAISLTTIILISAGAYLAISSSASSSRGQQINEHQQQRVDTSVPEIKTMINAEDEELPFSFVGLVFETDDNDNKNDEGLQEQEQQKKSMSPTTMIDSKSINNKTSQHTNNDESIVLTYEDVINRIISNVTNPSSSSNVHSKAAIDWIIFNDPLKYCIMINDDKFPQNCNSTEMISKEKLIQRYAMTLFYYTTGSTVENEQQRTQEKHPLQPSMFLTGVDECEWMKNDYIKCNNDGFISMMSLPRMNLTGTLPSELSLLHSLEKLELNGNKFYGTIPYSLYGKLDHLYYLDLSYNSLTGSIITSSLPSSSLSSSSSSLEYLYLSHNKLKGSISSDSIEQLKNLKYLWLQENEIRGRVPSSLFDLKYLQSLILYGNKLTGTIPRPIKTLQYLTYADFSYNKLNGRFNRGAFESKSLQYLYLNNNELTGTIPDVTKDAGNYSVLHHLWLNGNLLRGEVPTRLARLSKLGALLLQDNHLEGAMPVEMCNLRDVAMNDLEADCSKNAETSGNYTIDCPCCTLCA